MQTTVTPTSSIAPPIREGPRWNSRKPATTTVTSTTRPMMSCQNGTSIPVSAPSEEHDWHAILTTLNLGGMARELAQHCALRRVDGSNVFLCLSPTHRHLQMKPAQDKLQQSLSEYFARSVQVSIELEEITGDTPAAVAQQRKAERQDRAVAAVEQDEFVRGVIDMFDATLIESSIKPV